jgi:predicted metal-dependent hydrolase
MSVFISYNHIDSDFVDKLALELIRNNVKVWRDEWKISVGDSIINAIESGIKGASFLIIVISKNSNQSRWVKKELNAALIREIEDKKINILPVVIDDCEIPLFLREKKFADFRSDFNLGLKKLLSVVTKKYNLDGGRRVNKDTSYYFDYAIDCSFSKQRFIMEIDIVSFDLEEQFSILTQFKFVSNEVSKTTTFTEYELKELKNKLLRTCAKEFINSPSRIKITSENTVRGDFSIMDKEEPSQFDINYRVKRLGTNEGGSLVFNIGALFIQICDDLFEKKYS